MKRISQREAHRLRKQVAKQDQHIRNMEQIVRGWRLWGRSEGREIFTIKDANTAALWSVATACKLGHATIVTQQGNDLILRSLPLPSESI